MKCGDTFLLYDGEDQNSKPHLHLVISEPDGHGQCVLVSITTRRAKSDTMVCLNIGDHPFITHPSVITYAYSKLLTTSKLIQMIDDGEATPKEQASEQLVSRAQQGMLETDRAPREVQQFFITVHQ